MGLGILDDAPFGGEDEPGRGRVEEGMRRGRGADEALVDQRKVVDRRRERPRRAGVVLVLGEKHSDGPQDVVGLRHDDGAGAQRVGPALFAERDGVGLAGREQHAVEGEVDFLRVEHNKSALDEDHELPARAAAEHAGDGLVAWGVHADVGAVRRDARVVAVGERVGEGMHRQHVRGDVEVAARLLRRGRVHVEHERVAVASGGGGAGWEHWLLGGWFWL